ncbi:uncharacterized protein L3040_007084 [Drepanopeziza brunnea f. sp. 'multigermtubi']|uniref:Cation-transporting ATPase 4 n=1 Tax=Marssonina brunnea f. sp. multigermtubi (strain MB_m1) TaxID=1072389 RepID=K1WJG9_MARBU|nr:cation-transporting ATPase 4 [Drepanopeziza brunnea f. sp. 'multigermtubi' MB_m1]EKD13001.1 cation-transporting ATPase 4 [Drepanopeziza brunnea f. sp. 'multigermtubi' MB_m1]KAJ5038217.1 hypothetical protein L3040_007084 [Drepanopeziza brunnea f. sp. 'multigermtubi']
MTEGKSRGPELASVFTALMVFAIVTVGLRCYTAVFILKRFYAEDWLSVVTLATYVAYSFCGLMAIHFGLGNHVHNVPMSQHPKALFWKYMGKCFYVLVAVLVKWVVGLLLLRICSHQRWQRNTIRTLLAIITVFNVFYIFTVIFQCWPIPYYWYIYTPSEHNRIKGSCNSHPLATIPTYVSMALNVVADWTLALLPVSVVWKSSMDRKTKASVVGILAIGSIASLATVTRIPYARQLLDKPDYLYNFTDLAIWSTVEIGLGLGASSLATLKPFFRQLNILLETRLPSLFTNSNNASTGTSSLERSWKARKRSNPLSTGLSGTFTEIGDEERELDMLPSKSSEAGIGGAIPPSHHAPVIITRPLASHPVSPTRHDFHDFHAS